MRWFRENWGLWLPIVFLFAIVAVAIGLLYWGQPDV